MIDVGQPFPVFSLQDQDGAEVTKADLKGAKAVVYFYPKDDTSGCTAEACGFRDSIPDFGPVKVIGVSPDSPNKHKKFIAKYGLNFTLLADPDKELIQACGLWIEKTLYGRKYMGVDRTTFLLDANGVIEKVWRKVKPEGHSDEVRAALQA